MSEKTIEQLQADNEALATELEKVKAKNAELLGKLKKAQQGSGEVSERIEALESENESLKAELRTHTFDAPVNAVFERMSGAGEVFRRAFEDYYDIIQDEEEGRFWIHDKEGRPVTKKVKYGKYGVDEIPREFNEDEVRDIIFETGIKELDFFLPKPKGSGAPGNTSSRVTPRPTEEKPKEEAKQSTQFGIR